MSSKGICGLRKGQYQILAAEDGMEGVGEFSFFWGSFFWWQDFR